MFYLTTNSTHELRRVAVINIVQLIENTWNEELKWLQRKGHDWKEGRKEKCFI